MAYIMIKIITDQIRTLEYNLHWVLVEWESGYNEQFLFVSIYLF